MGIGSTKQHSALVKWNLSLVMGDGLLPCQTVASITSPPPKDPPRACTILNKLLLLHGRPGCGSRQPTGLRLALREGVLVPPRQESRLARVRF